MKMYPLSFIYTHDPTFLFHVEHWPKTWSDCPHGTGFIENFSADTKIFRIFNLSISLYQ